MDSLTVGRWIAAPPEEVWHRALDLQRLVLEDHALDLEDLLGEHAEGTVPGLGSHAIITRRHGARVERIAIDVEGRVEPASVTAALTTGGERWVLTITVTALPGDHGCGSDVRLRADRDPATSRGRGPRSLNRSHRSAHTLSLLLDGLAHQLEPGPTPQRIAAGR